MNADEHLQDRHAFELALLRVRSRAEEEGREMTYGEAVKEATKELEAENKRLREKIASYGADAARED